MLEKNLKKEKAKRNRVMFEGRFCTITHKSKKHPERQDMKKAFRILVDQYK